MIRILPPLLAALFLLGTGVVHGLWTERWGMSGELEAAVARLDRLPDTVGPWQGRPEPQDPASLQAAGARGHWSVRFTHAQTGEAVLVILLCGRPGPLSVHLPEHCYGSAGYALDAAPLRCVLSPDDPAELWTARFSREQADGPLPVRIFWSWMAPGSAAGGWQAPDNPRFAFARSRALYKLYAIRALATGREPAEQDPCLDLLRRLLPRLAETLVPS